MSSIDSEEIRNFKLCEDARCICSHYLHEAHEGYHAMSIQEFDAWITKQLQDRYGFVAKKIMERRYN